ncbi:DNA/RNA polymerase [Xylariomycetidae sp. FL2044]|nr:DNA/RNA polymerase [Xylariomycetidae sp. FL2044]
MTPNPVPNVVRRPKSNDDRVILHFDYDCFYASVFENENPALKSLPLGIKQKSILATCNYVARARGVKKLMLISEAQRICPDLVLMNGEDLNRFRDVSKKLWSVLRAYSWNKRVERLGLDEVFLDVTDIITYNQEMLNPHAPRDSFFHLDQRDPEKGFGFDGSRFFGCVYPAVDPDADAILANPSHIRLMLASHLAGHLRHKLEEDFGYTSSGGVSTNKTLAKLAGSVNKPKNQTTLLNLRGGEHAPDDDADSIQSFMDAHPIRKIPGIGSRIAHLVQNHVLSTTTEHVPHDLEEGARVMVREVRRHPGMSPAALEKLLDRPGSERGAGEKVWNLLHGVDAAEVKQASDVPTQISIEDTYMARPLNTVPELMRELRALSASLVRRMRVDLVADADPYKAAAAADGDPGTTRDDARRWIAHPKTIRLSTRTRPKTARPTSSTSSSTPATTTTTTTAAAPESFSRTTRSAPLPSFTTSLRDAPEAVAERLVTETVLPLFRRIHGDRQGGWNLALLNICVTNMVVVARDDDDDRSGGGSGGGGRDIGRMFRTQVDKLREFQVYDTSSSSSLSSPPTPPATTMTRWVDDDGTGDFIDDVDDYEEREEEEGYDDEDEEAAIESTLTCTLCGHTIPVFATAAHERFHAMGGD